jgi:uncharacterized membrane protein
MDVQYVILCATGWVWAVVMVILASRRASKRRGFDAILEKDHDPTAQ